MGVSFDERTGMCPIHRIYFPKYNNFRISARAGSSARTLSSAEKYIHPCDWGGGGDIVGVASVFSLFVCSFLAGHPEI